LAWLAAEALTTGLLHPFGRQLTRNAAFCLFDMTSIPQDESTFAFAQSKGKTFTRAEVAKHNKDGDLWIVIDGAVYDLTKCPFARRPRTSDRAVVDMHPGGAYVLIDTKVAGRDATEAFFQMHRYEILNKYRRLAIGVIENEKPKLVYPKKGALSLVPHAEPTWLSKGFSSPYFDDSHRKLQKFMRAWAA